MGISESLKKIVQEKALVAMKENMSKIGLPTAGNLMLVRKDSEEGKDRQKMKGSVLESIEVEGQVFFICSW